MTYKQLIRETEDLQPITAPRSQSYTPRLEVFPSPNSEKPIAGAREHIEDAVDTWEVDPEDTTVSIGTGISVASGGIAGAAIGKMLGGRFGAVVGAVLGGVVGSFTKDTLNAPNKFDSKVANQTDHHDGRTSNKLESDYISKEEDSVIAKASQAQNGEQELVRLPIPELRLVKESTIDEQLSSESVELGRTETKRQPERQLVEIRDLRQGKFDRPAPETAYQDSSEASNYVFAMMSNGAQYKGEISNGKPNGLGTITFQSGSCYEGEFKNGKIEGYGIAKLRNGDRYEGKFKNAKPNGRGIATLANQTVIAGIWKDSKLMQRL